MKHLYERLVSPTPKFFKKLQRLGLSISALGTALQVVPGVTASIVAIAGYCIVAGGVIVAIAQCAVVNTSDLTETPNQ